MIGAKGSRHDLGIGARSPRQRSASARIAAGILVEIGVGGHILSERAAAKQFLGGDLGQIDRRVRMNQGKGVVGPIGHQQPVERQRIPKPAVLKRHVPEKLNGVVSPGTAERLIDHAAERALILIRNALAEPPLGQGIDPVAIDLPSFWGQLSQRSMAESARVHKQNKLARRVQPRLVLGHLGDLAGELVDHPLVKIDRFRPLPGADVPGGVSQEVLGRIARVRIKLRRTPVRALTPGRPHQQAQQAHELPPDQKARSSESTVPTRSEPHHDLAPFAPTFSFDSAGRIII